jgi:glutamate-1-semialdehyde aminotransferase
VLTDRPLRSYRDLDPTDTRMERVFQHLLDAGVFLGMNGLGCLSTPMGEAEIGTLAGALEQALAALRRETR